MSMRIVKFLCTGGIGATVNLGTLFILVDICGIQYLIGSALAFCGAAVVGFLLQKYWTFAERSSERATVQFGLYVSIAVANICVNTLLVLLLVEWFEAHYLVAQFIGAGMVAVSSFVMYQRLVFRVPSMAK